MSSDSKPFAVGDVCADIRNRLEKNFPNIPVIGEVTNLSRPSSGHLYFTLRDCSGNDAILAAVMYRSEAARLRFSPANGQQLIAIGKLTIYGQQGRFQLVARTLQPVGIGERELALRQLTEKLRAEGLFDPNRKRAIPRFPSRIGVITSGTGSAIRDILEKLRERWPAAEVRVFPVPVQGERAPAAIASTLNWINLLADLPEHRMDVLIVGRGGGSIEDLDAFNEEMVARAVADSVTPVISGVGHEDDRTICDLVADQRALTPTDAAVKATPSRTDLLAFVQFMRQQLEKAMRLRLADSFDDLRHARAKLRRDVLQMRLDALKRRVENSAERLRGQIVGKMEKMHLRLRALAGRLDAVSPLQVLGRGYSLTKVLSDSGTGKLVFDASEVASGQRLETIVAKGTIISVVV